MAIPKNTDPQFKLRLPNDLLQALAGSANANNRSTNAEIVSRLEASGETLRDRFAMAALGIGIDWTEVHETGGYAEAAQVAYEVADAMLAARKTGGTE